MAQPQFKPCMQDQPMLLPPTFDDIIPQDSLIRIVDCIVRSLDRSKLESLYPGGGTSAYDPQMLLKVILYCYAQGIYSSRKIAHATECDINLLWVTGMHPLEHNTINRFRTCRVRPIFEEIFSEVVILLAQAGYIDMTTYFLDGTKIEANANKFSFVWSKATDSYTDKLRAKMHAHLDAIDKICDEEEALAPDAPDVIDSQTLHDVAERINARIGAKEQATEEKDDEVKELRRLARLLEKDFIPRMERYEAQTAIAHGRASYSKTDPDATFMRMKEDHHNNNATPRAAYNIQMTTSNQYVIGVSAHQTSTDAALAIPHLTYLNNLYRYLPPVLCADAGYGSHETYLWLEAANIKALVAHNESHRLTKKKYRDDPMRTANWPYDEFSDSYMCPNKKPLVFDHVKEVKTRNGFISRVNIYECTSCKGCTLAKSCRGKYANSDTPKTLQINAELDRLKEQANDLLASVCGRAIYTRRKTDVETVFGDIKQNMHFTRFSLRGLAKVTHEFLLVAMGHNLRKLVKDIQESGNYLLEALKIKELSLDIA